MLYSGDDFYGDEITSGTFANGDCGWCGGVGEVGGCEVCGLVDDIEAELEDEDVVDYQTQRLIEARWEERY